MRMSMGENARMAFNNLRENKMRSVLTVLGVVIGVTALITVSSVLVGLDTSIHDYLSEFGADTIFVFKFNPGIHTTRPTPEELNRKPLTLDDAMAIKASVRPFGKWMCRRSRKLMVHCPRLPSQNMKAAK